MPRHRWSLGVPRVIRVHFETARNLLLYSWFVYPFQQVAEMHAFASVEYALRMRSGLPVGQRGETLGRLLNRAVKEGWVRHEGFQEHRRIAEWRAASEQEKAALTGAEPDPVETQELQLRHEPRWRQKPRAKVDGLPESPMNDRRGPCPRQRFLGCWRGRLRHFPQELEALGPYSVTRSTLAPSFASFRSSAS